MQSEKTKIFIEKARAKHGDKFGYSLVSYKSAITLVTLLCDLHGEFEITPNKHLCGRGCRKCANNTKLTSEQFISRARAIHGCRYDYRLVNYKGSKVNIEITCDQHGEFWQNPSAHLKGHGCPSCVGLKKASNVTFADKARLIHGDKYDYSRVNYKNKNSKVIVICHQHGDFEQEAGAHTQGQGCPNCSWDRKVVTDLYLLSNGRQVKVGISIDTDRRLRQLNKSQPFKATIVHRWSLPTFDKARAMESLIHSRLSCHGSVFDSAFDGSTEWFDIEPELAKQLIISII